MVMASPFGTKAGVLKTPSPIAPPSPFTSFAPTPTASPMTPAAQPVLTANMSQSGLQSLRPQNWGTPQPVNGGMMAQRSQPQQSMFNPAQMQGGGQDWAAMFGNMAQQAMGGQRQNIPVDPYAVNPETQMSLRRGIDPDVLSAQQAAAAPSGDTWLAQHPEFANVDPNSPEGKVMMQAQMLQSGGSAKPYIASGDETDADWARINERLAATGRPTVNR